MSIRIALITIILAYCSVHTCRAAKVTWTTGTGPFDIPESTPKESFKTFAATGVTNYTILSQNVTGRFAISSTGVLSSVIKLDYESDQKSYSVQIMAFNNTVTGKTQNASLTCVIQVIDVNDEQPRFDKQSYSVNIPNDVANDKNVLNVSATDGDVSNKFKIVVYSFKEGGDKANFTIDRDTGVIKAANNLTGPHTFKITVVATDSDNATFTDEASVSMCLRCTSGSSSLDISMFAFMALVFGVVLM